MLHKQIEHLSGQAFYSVDIPSANAGMVVISAMGRVTTKFPLTCGYVTHSREVLSCCSVECVVEDASDEQRQRFKVVRLNEPVCGDFLLSSAGFKVGPHHIRRPSLWSLGPDIISVLADQQAVS
jgi:hypothetical protein